LTKKWHWCRGTRNDRLADAKKYFLCSSGSFGRFLSQQTVCAYNGTAERQIIDIAP
jgi:hypothetical protein